MRRLLKRLNQLCKVITRVCGLLCIVLLGVLVVLICLEVFFRYVIGHALSWPEEIAGFCFVWLTLLGATICMYKKSHVAIAILVNKLPSTIKRVVSIASYILIAGFSYLLVSQGYILLKVVSLQLSPAVRINMAWVYSAPVVTGVIFLLYSFVSILNCVFTGDDTLRSIS